MAFENIFRKASVTLVAGAYALFVEAALWPRLKRS